MYVYGGYNEIEGVGTVFATVTDYHRAVLVNDLSSCGVTPLRHINGISWIQQDPSPRHNVLSH